MKNKSKLWMKNVLIELSKNEEKKDVTLRNERVSHNLCTCMLD